MMNKVFYSLVTISLLLMLPMFSFSQTVTNKEALLKMSGEQERASYIMKNEAIDIAKGRNLVIRKVYEDGRIIELIGFSNGIPKYLTTHNREGGELINSSVLYPGGGMGLELTGAGQVLGIWDGGIARPDHQEFMHNGSSRITVMDTDIDNPDNDGEEFVFGDHATHVAGTMIAAGIESGARGMSYNAELLSWDWNYDVSEMADAAVEGLKVSQHSYGYITGWQMGDFSGEEGWHWFSNSSISAEEAYEFGFYNRDASAWDELTYYAPYYLIVKSAGNFRGQGPEPGETHFVSVNGEWVESNDVREINGGDDGYDCISYTSLAKNIIVVGAVDINLEQAFFSSWGPTDDGRIKPDLVAKGWGVFSSTAEEVDTYGTWAGTSMAGPMVSGSVGLMLEHQENLNPEDSLLSSTLKALLIHTANDTLNGFPGPDYSNGWGLMNTGAAVEIMSLNHQSDGIHIIEGIIKDGEEITIPVRAADNQPLQATMVWTDVPGTPVAPSLNPTNLMLVNDLDMRFENEAQEVFMPFILDPANPSLPATTGNNFRDNVEMVRVGNSVEDEIYTLTINHKGSLTNGQQTFSLVISGNVHLTGVHNPVDLVAATVSESQIDITWSKNNDDNSVMLVYSNEASPGYPEIGASYEVGDNIPGVGTVIYKGDQTSFQHEGLDHTTYYFYNAFSFDEANNYSTGVRVFQHTAAGIVTSLPFSEDFNFLQEIPPGWSTIDNLGNDITWEIGRHRNGLEGTTGYYAFVNSDELGSGSRQDTDLFSPEFDFTGYAEVTVSFTHFFEQYNLSSGTLHYTTDDGIEWIEIREWDKTTENPEYYTTVVPGAAGQSSVRFKWNYTGNFDWWWDVDDIQIDAAEDIGWPTVTTLPVTDITLSTANSGGEVTDEGSSEVTRRGVVVGMGTVPTIDNNFIMTSDGQGTGQFASEVAGLEGGTSYNLRAYATNSHGTAYGDNISFMTEIPDFEIIPGDGVVDVDGNEYPSIIIGEQEFTAKNLSVTRYADLSPIEHREADSLGVSQGGVYSIYPHSSVNDIYSDEEMVELYGLHYDYYSVATNKLCPNGWHVPGLEDWIQLIEFIMDEYFVDFSELGQFFKSRRYYDSDPIDEFGVTEHPYWVIEEGAPGLDAFGFNALPAGHISDFNTLGLLSVFWMSEMPVAIFLSADDNELGMGMIPVELRVSVRCIKGVLPVVSTGQLINITHSSAEIGGTIDEAGSSAVISRGVVWNTAGNPELKLEHYTGYTEDGDGTGSFTSTIEDLLPETTYHVRAYARNISGVEYGDPVQFSTQPTSSEIITTTEELIAYPNPFSATIQLSLPGGITRVTLTDMTGRQVLDVNLDGASDHTINTSGLPSGIYLVTVTDSAGNRSVTVMMKN